MKLNKEDIKKYGTEDEQKKLFEVMKPVKRKRARPGMGKLIFLVFSSTQYVETFEDTFLGAFTDGKAAYMAAEEWSKKNRKRSNGTYNIYQVMTNTDLSKGQAEDVTDYFDDVYGEQYEDETE